MANPTSPPPSEVEEVFAPGVAPVKGKDRYYKWSPRDWNPLAVPQSGTPSAAVMTATADAINAMGLEDVPQEFEAGEYYVDRTISPSGFSEDDALGKKIIHYNNTILRTHSSVPASNFQECFDQQTGLGSLKGLDDPADNLPAGVVTRCLIDVTNTEGSTYVGNLEINGGGIALGLAAFAAAFRGLHDKGANRCSWGDVTIKNCKWGLFGTPKYGQARNFYCSPFVGNTWNHLRIFSNVETPILAGANTMDDCFITQLSLIYGKGCRSYIFGCNVNAGAIFTGGDDDFVHCFDIQKSSLIFNTMYAEQDFLSPIIARKGSWVQGMLKYGAGSPSTFAKKAFIYNVDSSGGGLLSSHPVSGDGADIKSLVLLKVMNGAKRNYTVHQPYGEADAMPFAMEANAGQTLSKADTLISNSSDGQAKWTVGGSSSAPTLTRTVP